MGRIIHGMLKRVEIATQFGYPELRIGLFGMVVVRNHDFAMWVATQPQRDRRFDRDSDPNDVAHLHIPVFPQLQRVNTCRERVGCGKPAESPVGRLCGPMLQLCFGILCSVLLVNGKKHVGLDFHAR